MIQSVLLKPGVATVSLRSDPAGPLRAASRAAGRRRGAGPGPRAAGEAAGGSCLGNFGVSRPALLGRANLIGLVLGCIEAKFCN